VLERGRIDEQRIGRLLHPNRSHMYQLGLLRVPQIAHQGASRRYRRLPSLEAKAIEARHPQLIDERLPRTLDIEVPAVDFGDGQLEARHFGNRRPHVVTAGHHDLPRSQHDDFVPQRLQPFGTGVLRDDELAGRHVHQRHSVSGGVRLRSRSRRDGQQEGGFARVQVGCVGQRPG
jgi:hypothetical protein